MQFYKRQEKAAEDMPLRETTDWGRGEPLTVKFDPTLIKGPTYLLKNQPVEQFYRESNLELSNVRLNDQLLPKALMDNLLEKQIGKKFPMDHPLTSQISQKALFPDFVAPEDVHKGEEALNATILSGRTPKKFDPVTVVNKSAGKPYRHEIVHEKLPSQHKGLSYYDNDYYQYPKPDQSQTFYPSPPSMLAPNRNIRAPEERLDARTANVLANKERELMQSANQIEYFADGLGTRAPLNSDDLTEKVARFVSTSQVVQDKMKPYFKRGDGISKATAVRIQGEEPPLSYEDYQSEGSLPGKKILTEVERDEIRMENGKEYKNFPLSQYKDVEKLPTFRGLGRAKTMIEISRTSQKVSKPNKLEEEKQRIEAEYKDRIQRMQMNNRQAEIDLIRPRENIELLRMKYASLEKPRDQNAAPLLRQNTAQYVKTFYDQTSKYLGERSELYRNPSIYDPRLLRQHVELTKEGAPMNRFYSDGSPYISSHLEGRTVRFADQVFDQHLNGTRAPLENILLDPNSVAHAVVQAGGFINKQSTYGDAYNTKKFLQENALVAREPIAYERLKQSEIDAQDVVLKEKNDDKTNEIPSGYPRIYGPMPPEPYEPLYCTNDISEMSDGYYKRSTHRVYASPNVKPSNRYEALRSDIEAMRAFEAEQNRVAQEREARAQSAHQSLMAESRNHEIAHSKHDRVARRDDPADKANDLIDPPRTTYSAAYQPYRFDHTVRCPPNEYYKQIEYSTTANEKPADLIELQDKWSKSIANRRFHSAFHTRSTDLRLPGGKKKVKTNISAHFA